MDLIEGIKTPRIIGRKNLSKASLWEMDLIEGIKTQGLLHVNHNLAVLWEMDLIEGIKTSQRNASHLPGFASSYEKWTW